MTSFEYFDLRKTLCHVLKQHYVALVGQHDCDGERVYSAIVQKTPLLKDMIFVSVSLPQGVVDRQAFFGILIENLIDSSKHIPSPINLHQESTAMLAGGGGTTGLEDYWLRKILNLLGEKAEANHLVIIFQDLANIAEEPLRALLLLLREYHRQIGNPGQSGSKLRFLIVGGFRLWTLCENKPSSIESPFNIAEPIFINGISPLEIRPLCYTQSLEEATLIYYLTDGVASLIEIACQDTIIELDDLFTYFALLEKHWNSLPDSCQEVLKSLSKLDITYLPGVRHSFRCPRIPNEFSCQSFLSDTLKHVFWSGFLKIRHGKMNFRSPVHKAFCLFQAGAMTDDVSTVTLFKKSLLPELKLLESSSDLINSEIDFQDAFQLLLNSSIISGNHPLAQLFQTLYQGGRQSEVREKLSLVASEPTRESYRIFVDLQCKSFKDLKKKIVKLSASIIDYDIEVNRFLGFYPFVSSSIPKSEIIPSTDRDFMPPEEPLLVENKNNNLAFQNIMDPEVFLTQEEVAPLILALIRFSSKDIESSDRNDTLVAAGVDESFINRLKLGAPSDKFASSLVAQCRAYHISNNQLNKHPLISLLQHLYSLAPIYNFTDKDIVLFSNLLERGQENFKALSCCCAVGCIESPKGTGIGTGVLVGKNLLLTCYHLFTKNQVQQAWVRFGYKEGSYGLEKVFELDLNFVEGRKQSDYALLKVNGNPLLDPIKTNVLSLNAGEDVRIIHHPQGKPVIISSFGQIVQVGEGYVDHNVDTYGGSSGAPILNRSWELIALHQGDPGINRRVANNAKSGVPIRAIWQEILPYLS